MRRQLRVFSEAGHAEFSARTITANKWEINVSVVVDEHGWQVRLSSPTANKVNHMALAPERLRSLLGDTLPIPLDQLSWMTVSEHQIPPDFTGASSGSTYLAVGTVAQGIELFQGARMPESSSILATLLPSDLISVLDDKETDVLAFSFTADVNDRFALCVRFRTTPTRLEALRATQIAPVDELDTPALLPWHWSIDRNPAFHPRLDIAVPPLPSLPPTCALFIRHTISQQLFYDIYQFRDYFEQYVDGEKAVARVLGHVELEAPTTSPRSGPMTMSLSIPASHLKR